MLKAAAIIAGIILLALGIHVGMIWVDPIPVRLGMPWREAKQQLNRVISFDVASGIQAGHSINEQTGHPDYLNRLLFVSFPDRRCLEIWLRADYDPNLGHKEPDWRINSLVLGPFGKGYGGKFAWIEFPKTYPDVINLGAYHLRVIVLWTAALIASALTVTATWRRARTRVARASIAPLTNL
ncbi:MAG: hypothetical protein WD768_07905 [Phycisphaeraceae bacterium]